MGAEQQPDEVLRACERIAEVIGPAPGGTLRQYVEFLTGLGRAACLSDDGTEAWTAAVRGELQRLPLSATRQPDPAFIRRLLGRRGVWLVSYLLASDEHHPANCFEYLCRGPDFPLDNLPSRARRDVRRGLRRFKIRLASPEELAQQGHAAHADTLSRHRDTPPDPAGIARYAQTRAATNFYDTWGAWSEDGNLAAWMSVYKIDDWAMVDLARSRTDALRDCPNNALLYAATRHYLEEERRAYVSYGLSTIQVNVNELAMHKYKIGMGYEAVAMHRHFVLRPLMRPLAQTRLGSWLLDCAARAFSRQAVLRKAAGLARLASGREKAPLAWADGAE